MRGGRHDAGMDVPIGASARVDGSTRTDAQIAGDAAESLAVVRLTAAGWQVLARNVHVGRHELDVVAIDPGPPRTLVIVEVRWRRSREYGLAEESVDHRKRSHLRLAAFGLLDRGALPGGEPLPQLPIRFDLVVVEPGQRGGEPRVRHHRAAF
jgi:putative endonuclease